MIRLPGTVALPASYFDGHFAITPFGLDANPCGPSCPLSTTSEPLLKVSGTMPV